MTGIRVGAPVVRETATHYRGRPLIMAAHPGYVELRQKGKRARFLIDWAAVYECAMKLEARRVMREKVEARQAARKRGKP